MTTFYHGLQQGATTEDRTNNSNKRVYCDWKAFQHLRFQFSIFIHVIQFLSEFRIKSIEIETVGDFTNEKLFSLFDQKFEPIQQPNTLGTFFPPWQLKPCCLFSLFCFHLVSSWSQTVSMGFEFGDCAALHQVKPPSGSVAEGWTEHYFCSTALTFKASFRALRLKGFWPSGYFTRLLPLQGISTKLCVKSLGCSECWHFFNADKYRFHVSVIRLLD